MIQDGNDKNDRESPGALSRREFLKLSGLGITALTVLPSSNFGADAPSKPSEGLSKDLLSASGIETTILTWADDPLTTVRIQWLQAAGAGETAEVLPASITWRKAKGATAAKLKSKVHRFGDASTRIWVHRIDVQGLEPGTRYEFQHDGEKDWLAYRTAPKDLSEDLVFAEGGDIGTNETMVAKLHGIAKDWDPLFAHVMGDLSYSNGVTLDLEVKFLQQWRRYMVAHGNRLIPIVPGIGNHEVRGGMDKTPAEAPYFYSLFDGLFSKKGAYGTVDLGGYLSIIMLDSAHTCPIADQVDFLKNKLLEKGSSPHLFVSYHVGGYPSVRDDKGKYAVAIREKWHPIIQSSKVRTVFEHHDHAFKRTVPLKDGQPSPDGVTFIGDGDWGRESRKTKTKEERPYLEKVSSDYNIWKVVLKKDRQIFAAYNEQNLIIDEFSRTL